MQAVDQLILTNSSLLGPVAPLSSVIEKMADHSIWGMTENFHPRHHVQSYFLAFKKDVLQRTFFWDFFSNIIPFATMSSVINAYETTWADYFATQGFLPAIVAPPELGLEYRRTKIAQLFRSQSYKTYPVDPCFFYPEELVMAGVPYVKVKLFQGNNHNRNLHRMMAYVVNAGVTVNDFPALSKFVD